MSEGQDDDPRVYCFLCRGRCESFLRNYPNPVCRDCDAKARTSKGQPPWTDCMKDEGDNPVFIQGHKAWRRYRFGGWVTMADPDDFPSIVEFSKHHFRAADSSEPKVKSNQSDFERISGTLEQLIQGRPDVLGREGLARFLRIQNPKTKKSKEPPPSFENWVVVELALRLKKDSSLGRLRHNHVYDKTDSRREQFRKSCLKARSCLGPWFLKISSDSLEASLKEKYPDLAFPERDPRVVIEVKTTHAMGQDASLWEDIGVVHTLNRHMSTEGLPMAIFICVTSTPLEADPKEDTPLGYLGMRRGSIAAVSCCTKSLSKPGQKPCDAPEVEGSLDRVLEPCS